MLQKLLVLVSLVFITHSSLAELYDRGNGMVYDSVLKITWLKDANYAQTSGYDADGKMTWKIATAWAESLSYGGFENWRLASAGNPPEEGYDITTGELGHMFYNNLKNKTTVDGVSCDRKCLTNTSFIDENTSKSVRFINLMSYSYWSQEEHRPIPFYAWSFGAMNGSYDLKSKKSRFHSWAVRDGDVGQQAR